MTWLQLEISTRWTKMTRLDEMRKEEQEDRWTKETMLDELKEEEEEEEGKLGRGIIRRRTAIQQNSVIEARKVSLRADVSELAECLS